MLLFCRFSRRGRFSGFFSLLISGLVVVFASKYRRSRKGALATHIEGSLPLEIFAPRLEGIKRGQAKWIRVVRLDYRAAGVGKTYNRGEDGGSINSSPVGISNTTWDVKEILDDAIIHEDGSAMFKVPAMQSIYLQVIDERGRVIQTTRTWDTLRPGETKGCAGCQQG